MGPRTIFIEGQRPVGRVGAQQARVDMAQQLALGIRRQATGLDPRRFALVAAVLDRVGPFSLARAELFGATSGGIGVDDPACDLAVAAALASAATGVAPPAGSAFVGEVALTGQVRAAPAMEQRLAAARAAGCITVFAPEGSGIPGGPRVVPVSRLEHALGWAGVENDVRDRSA